MVGISFIFFSCDFSCLTAAKPTSTQTVRLALGKAFFVTFDITKVDFVPLVDHFRVAESTIGGISWPLLISDRISFKISTFKLLGIDEILLGSLSFVTVNFIEHLLECILHKFIAFRSNTLQLAEFMGSLIRLIFLNHSAFGILTHLYTYRSWVLYL